MSRRQSSVMQPMAGGLGFDYDSEEDDETPQPEPAPAASGNHRPMVGGFAAAAYEAARAHHLAQQAAKQKAATKK